MKLKYYLDTCIWVDLYEERTGYFGEPFGDWAWKVLSLIKETESKLIITDILIEELLVRYLPEEIRGMMNFFKENIEKIKLIEKQKEAARKITLERNLPLGDVLHAIIARDHNLLFVTRDNHFRKLIDITKFLHPRKLI